MDKPIVHAFFVCYNEANILPHLIKYYSTFCEQITFLDNGSTDNSVEIINSFPNTDIIPFESNGEFHDGIHIKLKNNVWKSSVGYADFVILGDADEFLYHENIVDFLIKSKENGVTFFVPEGYHMVADEDFIISTDLNLLEKVIGGVRTPVLDKPMMFDCNKINNINYNFGCHSARPEGDIVVHQHNGLKILHYKFLGMKDHKYKQKIRAERLSSFNKQHGFGLYYLISEKEQEEDYRSYLHKRVKII